MFNKKTIVMSLNEPYIQYAMAAIYSILNMNPNYDINCLAVNIEKLNFYPFNDKRVKITYLKKHFKGPAFLSPNKPHNYDPERCFMTICRFELAHSLISKYDIIMILDADSVCIKDFIEIEKQMINNDIGIIKITDKKPDFAKYSAAFIVFNTFRLHCINKWLNIWKDEIEKLDLYFFNDQLAMFEAIEKFKIKYLYLSVKKYCSFIKYPETIIVMTAGRIKETRSLDYNKEYSRIKSEIELNSRI